MRIKTERTLMYTTTTLRFSATEQATLRRAEAIAAEARRRCEERFGPDWEQEDADTELAHIEHGVREVIDGIELEARYR